MLCVYYTCILRMMCKTMSCMLCLCSNILRKKKWLCLNNNFQGNTFGNIQISCQKTKQIYLLHYLVFLLTFMFIKAINIQIHQLIPKDLLISTVDIFSQFFSYLPHVLNSMLLFPLTFLFKNDFLLISLMENKDLALCFLAINLDTRHISYCLCFFVRSLI